MVSRNTEKNCVYSFYSDSVERLVEELRDFCVSSYGDSCEFRHVEVKRSRSGTSWTLHEFDYMNDDAVEAMQRHLKTSIDSVRVEFGGEDEELEIRICRPGNSSVLSRFLGREELEGAGEDSLVVLAVDGGSLERAEEFLQDIE